MGESKVHKDLKEEFAGKTGRTEVRLPSGRIVDAVSGTGIVTEVELDGRAGQKAAVSRQKEAQAIGLARKVRLVVPSGKEDSAVHEMRRQRLGGWVQSTDGGVKISVPKRRKSTKY